MEAAIQRAQKLAIRRWWPFALLCIAASSEWLATHAWPQAASTLGSEAAGCALAAVVAFAFAWRGCRGQRFAPMAFFAGMMLLAGPLLGMFLDASMLNPGSLLVALALTPVVIAVAETAVPGGDEQPRHHSASSLWPGIAAAAALLIVLPLPSLSNPRNVVVLVFAPLLTGIGCVLFRRSVESGAGTGTGWHVPAALAGAAMVFALGAATRAVSVHSFVAPTLPAIAIDLLLALFAVLAVRRLNATRYAARFVLVPLLLLLEGFVSFHIVPSWRAIVCVLLLTASTTALLSEQQSASDNVPPRITG